MDFQPHLGILQLLFQYQVHPLSQELVVLAIHHAISEPDNVDGDLTSLITSTSFDL